MTFVVRFKRRNIAAKQLRTMRDKRKYIPAVHLGDPLAGLAASVRYKWGSVSKKFPFVTFRHSERTAGDFLKIARF
ncbi:hypothetical protein M413DRAFT_449076, partial [Hebeloma cylindrosporum]